MEGGYAFVPEPSLNEYFVNQFRQALSHSMAIASQKVQICLQGKFYAEIIKFIGILSSAEIIKSAEILKSAESIKFAEVQKSAEILKSAETIKFAEVQKSAYL